MRMCPALHRPTRTQPWHRHTSSIVCGAINHSTGIPNKKMFVTVGNGKFKLNTDGKGFTILYSFTEFNHIAPHTNSDGARPKAELILSGNTLYGTTYQGGSSGK